MKMITLKNPETGARYEMDAAAMKELRDNLGFAEQHGRDRFTFRAMLIDVESAKKILATDV